MPELTIRKSRTDDLPAMLNIYASAREWMKANGNPSQWITYPEEKLLASDIEAGISYVLTDGGRICGTFVFYEGEEPEYALIEGSWLDNGPYGVIHRIASDGTARGVLKAAVSFASRCVRSVRIDTHRDNRPMLCALQQLGFFRCGIIYIADDVSDRSPRVAFQLLF